jgi:hypothetical protein
MKEMFKDLAEAAKNLGSQATEMATEVMEQAGVHVGKMGDLGGDVAETMTDDINTLLPAIRKAGYSIEGLDLDLALPPKFVVICKLQIQIPEEERKALLESIASSKVSTMAVSALFRLSDVQKGLILGSLVPKEVLLEVGLSPALRVRYRDETPA